MQTKRVTTLNTILRSLTLVLTFTLSFCAFADDTGAEIPPAVYAAQEAAASAVNYGQTLCDTPGYYCRAVTTKDNWFTLFPNFQQREEVMRLNRTNVALMYKNWIVVPKSFKKTTYMDMSPLPKHINTHGEKEVYVNLGLFAFGAYDKTGKLVYWGPVTAVAKNVMTPIKLVRRSLENSAYFVSKEKIAYHTNIHSKHMAAIQCLIACIFTVVLHCIIQLCLVLSIEAPAVFVCLKPMQNG